MNELQEKYDERSRSSVNNFILWIRSEYYKYVIVPVIREFIKQTSSDWWSVLYWKIVERWCGQWHKMLKTVEWLLWDKFDFFWIEPSQWMRRIAEKRFENDERVKIVDWFAENLPFEGWSIDFIFDIQMQHHHTDDKKREMIKEANRVLRDWGHIYILDTFVPPSTSLLSSVKQKIFSLLQWIYIEEVWKWEYHNWTLNETISILEQEWFEINQRYSKWFKVFLWHILWFDFINQIIAIKNPKKPNN